MTALPPPARSVRARTTFTGYHQWPGASGEREYLAARHRHEFTATVELGVTHGDREVEFHDLGDFLAGLPAKCFTVRARTGATIIELGTSSCEQVAAVLAADLEQRWPGRLLWVEVSEDQQVTARLTYRAELGL